MDRFDQNFVHSISVFASTSKTGEATETRDLLVTTSGAPVAEFNQGYLKSPGYKLERTLDRVAAYQKRVGLPLRLHLSSDHEAAGAALVERGLVLSDSVPMMVRDSRAEAAKPIAELEVVTARDDATLREFSALAFETFGYPVELAPIALTSSLMELPQAELYVGRLGGEPACCSMILCTGRVAGIYWVGVRASHRKKGLGAAITEHAVQAAFERGCTEICLQASRLGAPVYGRIGFVTKRRYQRYDLATV